MKPFAVLLVLAVALVSCGSNPLSVDEQISEMKKCEAAGFRAKRLVNDFGQTMEIVCIPKEEK